MSSSALKSLKAAGGKWCFVDGERHLRQDRIRELEAKAEVTKKGGSKTNEKTRTSKADPT